MQKPIFAIASVMWAAACAPRGEAPTDSPAAAAPESYEAEGLVARPLEDIAAALANGEATSLEITKAYLVRIETIDRAGPELQAVLAINPDALNQAEASDARRATGKALGPLDGVPILVKDNIETADPMPTTAGSLALKDNVTGRDSPLVAGLRAQGAVILGKTNLSEWANFRSNDSLSGWSALGGQTRNPHILSRNPCGSSSGSAVAVAASLAAGAIGTETNGSISCPSSVNGVVGFKPTVGRISQQYIVPISASQDTAGPMATTVKGAAMLFAAIQTGPLRDGGVAMDVIGGPTDLAAARMPVLSADSLKGKRVGVARFAQGSNPHIVALFEAALKDLQAAGAELVDIKEFERPKDFGEQSGLLLRYEFKAGIDAYLADAAPEVKARSLEALIAFNKEHAHDELALFGQDIFEEAVKSKALDAPEYVAARKAVQKATRQDGVDRVLSEHRVEVIVAPSAPLAPPIDVVNGDVWPQWVGAGGLAAVAGYPHLTVPMGAHRRLPVGISFIGAKNADEAILSYGYAYEQASQKRVEPRYLPKAEEQPEIVGALRRKPS